jgi:glucose-6-phosphate isomerase
MLTDLPSYKALEVHYQEIRGRHLRDLFAEDPGRGDRFHAEAAGLYLDYSKNRITDQTVRLLVALANECGLRERIDAMFRGDKINSTEGRSVLHTALRAPRGQSLAAHAVPEAGEPVHRSLEHMAEFANQVRAGALLGFTRKPIRNIVNIGIGGCELGLVLGCEALRHYSKRNLSFRFVSNVDGTDFKEAMRGLNPEQTLFIVATKTFDTLETVANSNSAKEWLLKELGDPAAVPRHFVATSMTAEKVLKLAVEFGIDPKNIFEFWEWVGGRYSMDASIGLPIMIAIGPENFRKMLAGFHAMDEHFRTTPFERNLPVLMGLLTVWYNNCFGAETVAVLPYDVYLRRLPAYLQQLTMESLGKGCTLDGEAITNYQTGTIYWGEPGTNGQHSFYQLIHQGTKLVPCDFIGFRKSLDKLGRHHDLLMANLFAQSKALAFGHPAPVGQPYRTFEGNRPSNTILADQLTPEILGALVALYEHSVFTQGVVWNVNPFDQYGVELGKELVHQIIPSMSRDSDLPKSDSSTVALLKWYRKG